MAQDCSIAFCRIKALTLSRSNLDWLVFLKCFGLLAVFAVSAAAADTFLTRVGDRWAFLPGLGEPNTNWNQLSFDDSNWAEGVMGFSRGYGAHSEATSLDTIATNFISSYFRKWFVVGDTSDIQWLTLRVDFS